MMRGQTQKYQMIVLRYILSDYWKSKKLIEYTTAKHIAYECMEGILDCPIKKPKYGIKRNDRITCKQ